MLEIVEYLARRLVDDPEAVRVEEVERDGDIVLQLFVAKDDVGKVIGRQGRIARALRTVVRASAARCRTRTASAATPTGCATRSSRARPASNGFSSGSTTT